MKRALLFLIVIAGLSAGLHAANPVKSGDKPQSTSADISLLANSSKFDFVAYGDIRFTDPSNTRVSNPEARQELVRKIAEVKPPFLVVTGDLVLKGGDPKDWKVWQAETAAWRSAGIRVFPVLGNHELSGDPRADNYFAQFPELEQKRWYTVRAGNALFFMMDSDSDAAGGDEWNWLTQQLAHVPDDVDFLFFVFHHPPYTHSTDMVPGRGHVARPSEEKLAAFLEQRQAALRQRFIVISGHVHNYERYEHGGVTYLVSGGGGATPYAIRRSPQDAYQAPGPTYHFLHFYLDGHNLRAEMVKQEVQNGKTTWAVKDTFELEAPETKRAN
jgi:Icc-related predicted phosphoesterase